MKYILSIFLLIMAASANAYTECNTKITGYFIGSDEVHDSAAHLWLNLTNGGSASINTTNAAFDVVVSTALSSLVADKPVKIRLFSDNADCTKHNSDMVGLWLFN